MYPVSDVCSATSLPRQYLVMLQLWVRTPPISLLFLHRFVWASESQSSWRGTWDRIIGGFNNPLCSSWTQSQLRLSRAMGNMGSVQDHKLHGVRFPLLAKNTCLTMRVMDTWGRLCHSYHLASKCLQAGEHISGTFLKWLLLCVVRWTRVTSQSHANAKPFWAYEKCPVNALCKHTDTV